MLNVRASGNLLKLKGVAFTLMLGFIVSAAAGSLCTVEYRMVRAEKTKSENATLILPAGKEIRVAVRCTADNNLFNKCRQVNHPSILDFVNRLPNGYEYLLAVTPYPNRDARYENPSIIFSNDLQSWSEDEVVNPIYPPPRDALVTSGPHNMDPHLVWDPVGREIRLYWGYWSRLERIRGWMFLRSRDGVNWVGPYKTNLPYYVSFSVIYDQSARKWRAWGIKIDVKPFEVWCYESDDGAEWVAVGKCNIPTVKYDGQSWQVWHATVRKVGDEFWMIAAMNPVGVSDGSAPINLFLLRTRDGINWKAYNTPILTVSRSLSDDRLYRAAFLIKEGRLYVIYSYQKSDGTWHIALTSTDVSFLVGSDTTDNVISEMFIGLKIRHYLNRTARMLIQNMPTALAGTTIVMTMILIIILLLSAILKLKVRIVILRIIS